MALRPPSHWVACLSTLLLQLVVALACAYASQTRHVLLVVAILVVYPFTFTPLVTWSGKQEPRYR